MTPLRDVEAYADPPDNTTALTLSTMFSDRSRSVSRVPGAPPRCDTPPTAPAPSTITTVQPVGRPGIVYCPTLMPGTAVIPAGVAPGALLR